MSVGAALRCAISPDADDLFMFRALLEGRIDTEGVRFVIETRDTDTLNRMAHGDGPDVTPGTWDEGTSPQRGM